MEIDEIANSIIVIIMFLVVFFNVIS